MDYQVVLTSRALHDLFEIVSFVAEKHPPAAGKIGLALFETAESLAFLPYRGPPMKRRLGLRKLPHLPHHLIIYRVNGSAETAWILRAAQDDDGVRLMLASFPADWHIVRNRPHPRRVTSSG